AIVADAQHAAVLAARQQGGAVGIADAGQQALVRLGDLLAAIEAMNGAGGGGEEGDVAEEMGGEDMAFEIKRCNCRHQAAVVWAAWQARKLFSIFSTSRSRPMKTRRDSRFSPSFHGRWWSPSTIMWTPCTT